jgi:hypothetical protein
MARMRFEEVRRVGEDVVVRVRRGDDGKGM